ncbi:hypothetical protein ABZ567_05385 [Streptomyces sp. NPDC016459]
MSAATGREGADEVEDESGSLRRDGPAEEPVAAYEEFTGMGAKERGK